MSDDAWRAPCGCKVGALLLPDPMPSGVSIPFPIRHEDRCPEYRPPPAGAVTFGGIAVLALCGCPWVTGARDGSGMEIRHWPECSEAVVAVGS